MPGISVTLQVNRGERRRGFERLRDIVTRHRRAWAAEHFERYLRGRWESELRAAGREYNRLLEDKGKPPTLKQFAGRAASATNHWFGGDISALYGALGEKVQSHPERVARMPSDRVAFAWSVFRELGGTPFRLPQVASVEAGDEQNERWRTYSNLKRLAEYSLWYVQLKESLGRPPELKEFGRNKLEWSASTLASDTDQAWERYRRAVEASLRMQPEAHVPPQLTPAAVQYATLLAGAGPAKPSSPIDSQSGAVPEDQPGRSWWKRMLGR